ncbi:MAG TPA: type II toxin-antitoxin system prevent-host-death family antitoxin [Gaiellaceae bacterium]|nr:type II toxin-antitoxin system prevent-host-death family antitoxin [Gaiellaceae bacterium]
MAWQLQEAKQRFSELVARARSEGPQRVTKHGREAVVVVAAEEYDALVGDEPDLLAFIRSAPDFELLELDRAADRGRDLEL